MVSRKKSVKEKKRLSMVSRKKSVKEKKVKFALEAPEANEVWLAGDFNNWGERTMPLKKGKESGIWKISVSLQPGRYEYKFIVDGNWINDPSHNNRIENSLGTENSVIEI